MKASDLMVGDFLKTTHNKKVIKVREIKQSCIYTEDNGYDYNEIEPIPLTKEILEKNGFKFGQYGECFFETLSTATITLFKFNGDIWWCHGIKIEFVHELQHVIRLCGIKKEIVL